MTLPRPTTNENMLGSLSGLVDALELGLAGRRVGLGSTTLTFVASALSDVKTVAHGLGSTPTVVLAFGRGQSTNTFWVNEWAAADATNISLRAQAPTALNGNWGCYWIAIS